jgi:hypothetical protein
MNHKQFDQFRTVAEGILTEYARTPFLETEALDLQVAQLLAKYAPDTNFIHHLGNVDGDVVLRSALAYFQLKLARSSA